MQTTEKELKDYAKAYCVFYKGRELVKKGQYDEGQKLLCQSVKMIGPAVVDQVGAVYAETDLQFTMADYHEYMGKAYIGKRNFAMALDHFHQWANHIVNYYGRDDIRLVPCYVQMAKASEHIDFARDELGKINLNSIFVFCQCMKVAMNIEMCYAKNMEIPANYYMKAYNIQKAQRGLDDSSTASLRDDILCFYWGNCLAMKIEQTLFMAETFIPLLLLLLLSIHKLCWYTLLVFIICVAAFIVWRIFDAIIDTWLTWRHYNAIL